MTIFLKNAAIFTLASAMGIGAALAESATSRTGNPSAGVTPPPTVSQSPSGTTPMQNLEVSPADVRRLFDTIDSNNDAVVTPEEWAAWQEIDMGNAGQGKPIAEADVPVFQHYDLDANGELEQGEFFRAALLRDEQRQGSGEAGSAGAGTSNPSLGGASATPGASGSRTGTGIN